MSGTYEASRTISKCSIPTVDFILDKELPIGEKARAYSSTPLVMFILVIGVRTVFMVKESTYLQVERFMMDCYQWIKSKGLVHTIMIMELLITQATGTKISSKVAEFWTRLSNTMKGSGIEVWSMETDTIKINLPHRFI